MKKILTVLLISFSYCVLYAQKPMIDTTAFTNWSSVGGGGISNSGQYVYYTVYNPHNGNHALMIKATTGAWEKEIASGSNANFTNNNQLAIFKTANDSLGLLSLGKDDIQYIPNVSEYNTPKNDYGKWLIYRVKTSANEVVLRNLITEHDQHFFGISNYLFTDDGKNLLLELSDGSAVPAKLELFNLLTMKTHIIWSGKNKYVNAGSYAFDESENQLVFWIKKKDDSQPVYQLMYYKIGMDTAETLVNSQTAAKVNNLEPLSQRPEFSKDGKRIFFRLAKLGSTQVPQKPGATHVDVWNYQDSVLQSVQLKELNSYSKNYALVVSIRDKQIITLGKEGDEFIFGIGAPDSVMLMTNHMGNDDIFESTWNLKAQQSYELVSSIDGSRRSLKTLIVPPNNSLALSPGGKWLIYYDLAKKNYFSYEIKTGIIKNITKKISTAWEANNSQMWADLRPTWDPNSKTWLADDGAVLIYDRYDIWQVDPAGEKSPINLTNGFGRSHHIKFTLLENGDALKRNSLSGKSSRQLLQAFNADNKEMGFYSALLGLSKNPELLSMGPYFYGDWMGHGYSKAPPALKARDTCIYLVSRMNAVKAPNYFVTNDFKIFRPLSDVQPENTWNWITDTLLHWKSTGGVISAGILYKPENFDPKKKYPIIFEYYENRSDELNLFIRPEPSDGEINIPFFVSNGYLVFVPDILHDRITEAGPGAYAAVVSAAQYLAKKPFVDKKRMGIQGHSFGGYETNYLVTHTNIFAAACSASGLCDLIGLYGSGMRGSYSMYWAENGQGRFKGTPWQVQQEYIRNSPIFQANKVNTPLLMMQNEHDGRVPFAQGIEFFNALQRMSKKAWMLQYDGEDHSVSGAAANDFNTRMTQFFDHYLKGAPAPKWMVEGVPASMKGIDNGLALEPAGIEPGPGLTGQQ